MITQMHDETNINVFSDLAQTSYGRIHKRTKGTDKHRKHSQKT